MIKVCPLFHVSFFAPPFSFHAPRSLLARNLRLPTALCTFWTLDCAAAVYGTDTDMTTTIVDGATNNKNSSSCEQITDPKVVKNYREIHHTHGLITTMLSLQFIINGKYFEEGALRAKCVATISPVLWRGGKESVVQWKPPPLIDNREAMFLGKLNSVVQSIVPVVTPYAFMPAAPLAALASVSQLAMYSGGCFVAGGCRFCR